MTTIVKSIHMLLPCKNRNVCAVACPSCSAIGALSSSVLDDCPFRRLAFGSDSSPGPIDRLGHDACEAVTPPYDRPGSELKTSKYVGERSKSRHRGALFDKKLLGTGIEKIRCVRGDISYLHAHTKKKSTVICVLLK